MKTIMSYVLTKSQKLALLLLVLLAALAVWYVGIYTPIQDRIAAADTADLEDQMAMEQMRASKIKSMQAEIDENVNAGAPVVPSYNNFKKELDELNATFGQAYEFDFSFSEPQQDGSGAQGIGVRRDISVTCQAENYDAAVELMRQILQGPYRSMIHDVAITSDDKRDNDPDFEPDVRQGRVSLSFNMTYFETTIGADTLEGILQQQTQSQPVGGLANADMSNLQRSDLETAAEAAFGE